MRVLAIDTATDVGTVAVLVDGQLRASASARVQSQHGETLLPLVERTLAGAALGIEDVELLAVGLGPGSFTGVRIGVATAKGLSLARRTPMKGVRTSRVLARGADGALRVVLVDAKKDEIFVAAYRRAGTSLELVLDDAHGRPDAVIERVRACVEGASDVTFVGSALVPHGARLREAFPDAVLLPEAYAAPSGAFLALEAHEAFLREGPDDPSALVPLYVRGADITTSARPAPKRA